MGRIAIISDLHFGTVPEGLDRALQEDLHAQDLDGVVVAGDMTQRARRVEFHAAAEFVAALPGQTMVIPGNHDLPAWNLWTRAISPYRRYTKHFGSPGIEEMRAPHLHVVGLNTTRRAQPHLRWQEGAIRRRDVASACEKFAATGEGEMRVLVAHHPLIPIPDVPRAQPVRRGAAAFANFLQCGVDVFVSGHTHLPFCERVGEGAIALGAPSALSNRLRGAANGYWVIEADATAMALELRSANGLRYETEREEGFAFG